MDVLSEVLESIKFQSWFFCASHLSAPWGIIFPGGQLAAVHIILENECWITVEEIDQSYHLTAGDIAVLPLDRSHTIKSDPRSYAHPLHDIPGLRLDQTYTTLEHGGRGKVTKILTASYQVESPLPSLFLEGFPPLIRLDRDNLDRTSLIQASLDLAQLEIRGERPGVSTVLRRLSEILFVQCLRTYLNAPYGYQGWLAALTDSDLGPVIAALHRTPEHKWKLEEMADLVNVSRSSFAARFKTVVGTTPLDYLTQWRMYLATNLLSEEGASVTEVAERVGYESEQSFTRAFKRQIGVSPGRYRAQHHR